ncbi:MAG: hypothetical protein F4230_13595 [Holophagales bacterium]|nr:hypothetical protein [Holophagales bacterium]MYJ26883.1 hypothetical protein [Holophagales bacterium]
MAIDFSDRRDQLRRQQAGSLRFVRVVVRLALLFAIGALAVLQGFSPTSWLLLGLLLAWGASMPFLLRGILRRVRELDHLARWQQLTLIWTAALILIGGFAVLARYVLLPSAPG